LFESLSPATSTSSLASGMSEWSLVSASSSFPPPSKKRDSDARSASTGSPSKYRKVGTDGRDLSYCAQAVAPSPPQSQAQPVVIDDVFNASSTPSVPKYIQVDPEPSIKPSRSTLDEFLSGPIGVDLDTSFIAHDAGVQALLDKEQISWGVQFELARGVTTGQWTWDAVKSKIGELTGPSAKAAPRVRSVMLDVPLKASDLTIWHVHLIIS
jgi:RNA-dependent RNA polymerase